MKWIEKGVEVKIFTARAVYKDQVKLIRDWLAENGLPDLEITNIKTPGMMLIYDDRAVHVRRNEGKITTSESDIKKAAARH